MNASENNNRLSPQLDLSSVGVFTSSSISWDETLNGQSITIETRVSLDGGSTWTSWQTATNGGSIPDLSEGDDVSNGLLECRQSLSTSDLATTPELHKLTVEVEGGGILIVTGHSALQARTVLTPSSYKIEGTILEGGTAVARTVRCYTRADGQLAATTTSSSSDGSFSFSGVSTETHFVVAFDDLSDETDYNAQIRDLISPVPESFT
jgi:hypothetical protein